MAYAGRRKSLSEKKIAILRAGKHWHNIDEKKFPEQKLAALLTACVLVGVRVAEVQEDKEIIVGTLGKYLIILEKQKLNYRIKTEGKDSPQHAVIGEDPIVGKLLELAGFD